MKKGEFMSLKQLLLVILSLHFCIVFANIPLTSDNDNVPIYEDNQVITRSVLFSMLYSYIETNDFQELDNLITHEELVDDINMQIMTIAVLLNNREVIEWIKLNNEKGNLASWQFINESDLLINLDLLHFNTVKIRQSISTIYAIFFNHLTKDFFNYLVEQESVHLFSHDMPFNCFEEDNYFLQILLDYGRIDLVYVYIMERYTEYEEEWDADAQYIVTMLLQYYYDVPQYKDLCYQLIAYLFQLGFSVNPQNECPRHIGRYITWATQHNLIDIVALLLTFGAPIDQIEDAYDHDACAEIEEILGMTSMQIAHKYEHIALMEALQQIA